MRKYFGFLLLLARIGLGLALAGIIPAQDQETAGSFFAPVDRTARPNETLIWPISGSETPDTDRISSPFGPRWQASQDRYDYHPGIDIAAPQDTPVHVVTDGIIFKVGWLSDDAGLSVVVYHPALDLYSAYLHLNSTPSLTVGQSVTQGEVIGYVGNSGTTDFMHLHFEIRLTANNYPASTRNPMGYLPLPDTTTPTITISDLQPVPIYSPVVSLAITARREELDVNQIRVILKDRDTGVILDDQLVDFNERIHTGTDSLDQDGIKLIPAHFNTSTPEYELTAKFYNLHGLDSFTLTAQVMDIAGNISTVTTTANDSTPPGKVTSLEARHRVDGGVDLTWLAPGDSGSIGTAATYDIRYADVPINEFVWANSATPLSDPPMPVQGDQWQSWSLPGSLPENIYFALRATDIEGNRSLISNSAQSRLFLFLPIAKIVS